MTIINSNPDTAAMNRPVLMVGPESNQHPVDTVELLRELNERSRCGFDQGLLLPRQTLLETLAERSRSQESTTQAVGRFVTNNLYVQERPFAWTPGGGIEKADVVKVKSMHDLTHDGKMLEEMLRQLAAGDTSLDTNEIGDWRIFNGLIRKLSIDEIPQVVYNVYGASGAPTENLMDMRMVGSIRPTLSHELEVAGDNSYDDYNKALEIVAEKLGSERLALHWHLGRTVEVGVVSLATGRGTRNLQDVSSYVQWIQGSLDYERIQKMSPKRRNVAEARILAMNLRHIVSKKSTTTVS